MGMPYGYNNSPYGMGQQNPYAGYNMPQQPQQQVATPHASLTPEQAQSLAQQNAQELGNNITNAALLGGVVGAGAGAVGVLNGEEGNLKQQYTYKQGGKEYQVTLKDKGASNPVAKRFGAKSDDGGRAVKHLIDGQSTYEFSNYYRGDINTPMVVRQTIQDGSSLKPVELFYKRNDKGVLELVEIKTPTGKKVNANLLRLNRGLKLKLEKRYDEAQKKWRLPGMNPEANDLAKRIADQKKAEREFNKIKAMLGDYADQVESWAKNGLKEGVDFPNLGKVVQEARVDKALDWSGMLKNIAKGGGLGLLVAGAGAGLLTLLTQQRPAYAKQSNPTPNQGFRPY